MPRLIPVLLWAGIAAVLISLTPGVYAEVATRDVVSVQPDGTVIVNTNTLNVREGPGTNYRILDQVNRGNRLTVLTRDTSGDWLQVRTPRNVTGWVSALYVTSAQSAGDLPSVSQPPISGLSNLSASESVCVARPFTPNSSTNADANIVECFGGGTTPLRWVAANTPVQVLGIGDYGPSGNEREKLGPGPYAKIRIWDGQYAWIAASYLRVDVGNLPRVSSICEICDRIIWSSVVRPTPTSAPSRSQSPDQGNSRSGCCKICTKGKACGNTCINVNYTCRVGPGCACNG